MATHTTSTSPGTIKSARDLTPGERERFERLMSSPIDFIDDTAFRQRGAYKKLFAEAMAVPTPNSSWYHPAMDRSPDASGKAVENKVLTAKEERTLFLQFNYARFRARQLQDKHERRMLTAKQTRELLSWHEMALDLQDRIAQFNLALVLAMVRRINTNADYAELISEGNLVLLHAINKFDISRGYKFSTYACRSILRALGRVGEKQTKLNRLFPATYEEDREMHGDDGFEESIQTAEGLDKLQRVIDSNAAKLSPLEQTIIKHRFPLRKSDGEWMTLRDLGKIIGYTKERTRQLQCQALNKLRRAMETPLPA